MPTALPLPDSSAVDAAIFTLLASDTTLLGLMPNGVYWEEAPAGSTRFVIVSLSGSVDEPVFGGRAFENLLYLVKAVGLTTAGADVKGAAQRIDELMEDAVLLAPGFVCMGSWREERVRLTHVDDGNADLRWQHRGGYYRVQMALQPDGRRAAAA